MASGTFALNVGSISLKTAAPGVWKGYDIVAGGLSTSNAVLVADLQSLAAFQGIGIYDNANVGGTCEIRVLMDNTNIILAGDINGTYTLPTLPPGLTFISALLEIIAGQNFVSSVTHVIRNGFSIYTSPSQVAANLSIALLPSLAPIDVLNDTYGITGVFNGSTPPGPAYIVDWPHITGTWTAISLSWTLVNNSPVQQGTPVTVTSSGPNAVDFTDVLTVTASFTDENGIPRTVNIPLIDWTAISANQFIFLLQLGGYQPQTVTLSITSTQFSGSVALGTLSTIYFRNAPGIYRIVAGKSNDTLYDVSNPGTTVDVKIPDPLAKTAFVP